MRKVLFLLIVFISLAVDAQNSQVKVSLRNGTAIVGEVKEFDALDHITIIVGDTWGSGTFVSFLLVRKKCIHGYGAGPCGDGRRLLEGI
jgi:hypothetical protein